MSEVVAVPKVTITWSRVCLLIAVISFVLGLFGVHPGGLDMLYFGLAFFAAAGLV